MGIKEHTDLLDDDRDNGGDGWLEEKYDADIMARKVLDDVREKYMTDANRCIYAVGTQTLDDEFELRCELEDMSMPCLIDLGDECEMYEADE